MDHRREKVLKHNFDALMKDLDPTLVLHKLIEEDIFRNHEYDEVKSKMTRLERNEELIMRLMQKGDDALDVFMMALKESHKHLFVLLLKDMKKKGLETAHLEGKRIWSLFLHRNVYDLFICMVQSDTGKWLSEFYKEIKKRGKSR